MYEIIPIFVFMNVKSAFLSIFLGALLFIVSCQSDNKKLKPGLIARHPSPLECKTLTYSLKYKQQWLLLDNYFKSIYQENVFSGTVLVAKQGLPIYKGAYGYANRSKRIPLDLDYAFQLGSVSKQFTAIAILILEERGKLCLMDSVQKYFPEFPYKNITIHSLLTHVAGLPNYIYFCDNMPINKEKFLTNSEVIKIMCDTFPEKYYPANKSFHYCNTNYVILAAIVEKVSGKTFEEFVSDEIFTPLEMTHSFFYSEMDLFKDQKIATGYLSPKIEAGFNYLNGVTGDKGIFSTVDDMLKWDLAVYSDKLIKRKTIEKAFQPQTRTRRHNIYYGYGWKIYYPDDSTKVLFHSGWWQGFQSVIMHIPKDTTTVIVLKNKKTAHPVNQSVILEILYPNNHFFKKKEMEKNRLEEIEDLE